MTKFRMHYLLVAILSVAISTVSAKPPPKPTAKPTAKPASKPKPTPVPLQLLVTAVQNAIEDVKPDLGPRKLTSAEFDFKLQSDKTGGVSANAWIVTLGVSMKNVDSSEVKFTYDVPDKPAKIDVEMLGFDKESLKRMQDDLTKVIKAAAPSIKAVPSVQDAKFHKLTCTLLYQVSFNENASVSVPIWNIIFGPKLDMTQTNTHSITLVFSEPTVVSPTPSPPASQSPRPTPSATPATP